MSEFDSKASAFATHGGIQDEEPRENVRPRRTKKWWHIGGQDVVFVPVSDDGVVSSKTDFDIDVTKTADGSVFADARTTDVYAPIEKFEGRHRFDPNATWTEEEETGLVRRVRPTLLSEDFI